jgi:hypothetical protein
MRKIIFAAVALLGFASAVPTFADTMQRDGDPSGSWRSPYSEPGPYGDWYAGRYYYGPAEPLVRPYSGEAY